MISLHFARISITVLKTGFLNYRMNTYSYYMAFLSLGVPHLILVEEARFTIKPPPRVLVHTQMRHYCFFGAQCMLWSMRTHF